MADIIRIRTTLTSDTPHLPELAPLVGRAVEIVVVEAAAPLTAPPPAPAVYDKLPAVYPWPSAEVVAAAEAASERLRNSTYDWDAWREQREIDRRHEEDKLRRWQQKPDTQEGGA